jgi:hypothetical protein
LYYYCECRNVEKYTSALRVRNDGYPRTFVLEKKKNKILLTPQALFHHATLLYIFSLVYILSSLPFILSFCKALQLVVQTILKRKSAAMPDQFIRLYKTYHGNIFIFILFLFSFQKCGHARPVHPFVQVLPWFFLT